MKLLRKLVFAATALSIATLTLGQGFPTHAITIVVPFSAGGPTDTIARIFAERMTRALGQTVVVENTTGAGGSIGVGRVVRATPDGYTLGIGHIGTHVVNGAIYPLPYDLLKDLAPVAMIASNPQVIVSKNAVPAKDLKEFVAWVKANPDKVSSRHRRLGHAVARERRVFPERHRREDPDHPLPRRRARDAGPDGGPHRHVVRPGRERAAAGAERQGPRLTRSHRRRACRPRPTSRRSTKPGCRGSTWPCGTASGCRRARRRR